MWGTFPTLRISAERGREEENENCTWSLDRRKWPLLQDDTLTAEKGL